MDTAPPMDRLTTQAPPRLINLEVAGLTDVGCQREYNQDYFYAHTVIQRRLSPQGEVVQGRGLYILCDGMGGHAGGDEASQLATHKLATYLLEHWTEGELPGPEVIQAGVGVANQAIYLRNEEEYRRGKGRMGTTLVAVLVQDNQVAVTHVGDSRVYRINQSEGLKQLTQDHEVGQWEIQRGTDPAIAYSRPDAYQLTQALGPRHEQTLEVDVEYFSVTEDTVLLLCSDGLSDNGLVEAHWQQYIKPLLLPQAGLIHLQAATKQLIDLANQLNGHDNITVVLVKMQVQPASPANG
ncbi:MAG: serine/threonine phosphatase [Gloeomargarita sp. GMQP_bins_120]